MKNHKNLVLNLKHLTIISCFFIGVSACSEGENNSNEDETQPSSENSSEMAEEVETENIEQQIVLDLDNSTFQQYLKEKNGILIDVRTPQEYEAGHIEGAVNKDFTSGEFENALDTLEKGQAVFVYCQAGGRSGKARDLLKANNFQEIYNLENGYGNWENQ